MNNYKILAAHPGKQHSYRLVTALKKNNKLLKYVTTIYFLEGQSLTGYISKVLTGDNKIRAERRRCKELEDSDIVIYNELSSLMLLAVQRVDKRNKIANILREYISKSFQKKVAKYAIKNQVDAVIMYDTNAHVCFDILKKKAPNIKRIIDNAQAARNFLQKEYMNKLEKSGDFAMTYENSGYLHSESIASKFGVEIQSAQYHIVASTFSKKSLEFNGIDSNKIYKIPYGVNADLFLPGNKDYSILKTLFVGEVNQRKGIYQILEAAKKLSSDQIMFDVVGSGKRNHEELYLPYEKYVNFHGHLLPERLKTFYSEASIFIFPSMGEGFGLVILEALSAGLPVICSENCVGRDIIIDGYNGFVIPAGDTEALIEKIEWFGANKNILPDMSRAARETALLYTWEKYEQGIEEAMNSILGEN